MLAQMLKQRLHQRTDDEGAGHVRQRPGHRLRHVQRAVAGCVAVQTLVHDPGRQPQPVLRGRKILPVSDPHFHDTAERVDELAPGVVVAGVARVGRHAGGTEHYRFRQLFAEGRVAQVPGGCGHLGASVIWGVSFVTF